MMIAVHRFLRNRLPDRRDDRGSLSMLIVVTIVGVALSTVLMSMVINQSRATRFDSTRNDSLNAAQAGVQVVIGTVRHAISSSDSAVGNDDTLPCGPFTGSVVEAGVVSYYAQVLYYWNDPIGDPTAQPMKCVTGYGPYDPVVGSHTPHFACIISSGVVETKAPAATDAQCSSATGSRNTAAANAASAGRTIVSTYVLSTDDSTRAGSRIRSFPNAYGHQYCMDAGSATPVSGTLVKMLECAPTPVPSQTWLYRGDLSIQLKSSVTGSSAGMCLDATLPHSAGGSVFVAACSALGLAPYNQIWSVDDQGKLQGTASNGTSIDGYCINVAGQSNNSPMQLQPCGGGGFDTSQKLDLSNKGGSGSAGTASGQLVNFQLFNRCLDVPVQNPASSVLDLAACALRNGANAVPWYQTFSPSPALGTGPSTVELTTRTNGTTYCLRSPQLAGGYPYLSPCPNGAPTAPSPFLWVVNQTKNSTGDVLPYTLKYTVIDSSTAGTNGALCLDLGASNDLSSGNYKASVNACDGTPSQKWNADPSVSASTTQNTVER